MKESDNDPEVEGRVIVIIPPVLEMIDFIIWFSNYNLVLKRRSRNVKVDA